MIPQRIEYQFAPNNDKFRNFVCNFSKKNPNKKCVFCSFIVLKTRLFDDTLMMLRKLAKPFQMVEYGIFVGCVLKIDRIRMQSMGIWTAAAADDDPTHHQHQMQYV